MGSFTAFAEIVAPVFIGGIVVIAEDEIIKPLLFTDFLQPGIEFREGFAFQAAVDADQVLLAAQPLAGFGIAAQNVLALYPEPGKKGAVKSVFLYRFRGRSPSAG